MSAIAAAPDAVAELTGVFARMLGRSEYLLPLAAADHQYRSHYYQLNAAALLEDLFFDAVGNYIRQHEPDAPFSRAVAGNVAWDYQAFGSTFSHKVLRKVDMIAVHWDATSVAATWTADGPMVVVLSESRPALWRWTRPSGSTFNAKAVRGDDLLPGGKHLFVVRHDEDESHVVEITPTGSEWSTASELMPFETIWRHVAAAVAAGRGANTIDAMVTTAAAPPPTTEPITLAQMLRPGVYVLRQSWMVNLTMTGNNRSGRLLPAATVAALLARSRDEGTFVPLPTWFSTYAAGRPPDLYATQRSEYDGFFSARMQ